MSSKDAKEKRKARPAARATMPGAVSCAFEEVDVEELGVVAPASLTPKKESAKAKRMADEAAKATAKRMVRATVPGVTMMEAEEPSAEAGVEAKKPKVASISMNRDRKAARGKAATVPGAVSMINENETDGAQEPEQIGIAKRITKGPREEEPELVDEGVKQYGKTRRKPATTPGVVRMQQETVTTASYGMEKPARVVTGEISTPGAVSVVVNEAQDAVVRRKDPRAHARTKKAGAVPPTVPQGGGDEGANAYQARMEKKIKTMEEELGLGSSTKNLDDEKKVISRGKSKGKDILKHRDDDDDIKKGLINDPRNGSLLPEQAAPYTTTADRGVAGAPDLVHGSTYGGYGGAGYGGLGNMSDEGLAVAIAIEEDEEELFFPAAIEYDPDSKPPLHKNRRFRVYGIGAFLLFVVIVIGVVIGLVAGGSKSKTFAPTGTPTESPSSSEEGKHYEVFAAVVGDAVMTAGTPHSMAANWIIAEDPANLSFDAPNLVQRYLLALFYFTTTNNGRNPWRSCNRPTGDEGDECQLLRFTRLEDDSIDYVPENAVRWLSAKHECEWVGNICDDIQTVQALEIMGQNITGTLPVEIKELPYLQSIALSYNEFTGTLPAEYASMKHLLNLEVHGNSLTGTIAEDFFLFKSLQNFNVGENMLSGTISTSIGLLTNLKGLHTFENMFSGSIPSEVGNLVDLGFTRHSKNRFNGTIPTEIGRLKLLQELWLQENTFTGAIPSEIGLLKDLTDIRFNANNLTGTIPDELYGFNMLASFHIYDIPGLTGTISTLIGQLTKLSDLRLRQTGITGTIPSEIGLLTDLRLGWFHRTELVGSMPMQVCANVGPGGLEYLQTDCGGSVPVSCDCCTACCDRQTSTACLILD